MSTKTHVCMLAAENDVIPGGKVGGIGDVIRDLPRALADQGARVTVVVPAYGAFHNLPGATLVDAYAVPFRGRTERVELYEIFPERDPGVGYFVLHHPLFAACGAGHVYCDDEANQPFATDASKFALFCVASLVAIRNGLFGDIDVLHLHDWHTGLAAVLRRFDLAFESLRRIRCVFSIHNLALQGIRPLAEHASSLQAWFPHLHYDPVLLADPRWANCVNPLAAAIRLSDKVHTVSPTYAQEIVQPNNADQGFHGGEGLEKDLQQAAYEGRLVGIINGIDYPTRPGIQQSNDYLLHQGVKTNGDVATGQLSWPIFMQLMSDELLNNMARDSSLRMIDYVAHQRLVSWQHATRPKHILTSIGRLTEQKLSLLLNPLPDGQIPLDVALQTLKGRGLLLILGSGDRQLEQECRLICARHSHGIFINRYSQALSDLLFASGDLFLMPSSFEPCGISQMLAMRDAQPCLVHAVGGLRDTIRDNIDGFHFSGDSLASQSIAMLQRLEQVLTLRERDPHAYQAIAATAHEQRFAWSNSAIRYLSELYT